MKRKLLQLHLSTALLLMVLAGGMVWLQIGWRMTKAYESYQNSGPDYENIVSFWPSDTHERGWPLQYQVYFEWPLDKPSSRPPFLVYQWRWKGLTLNILVALGILAAAGVGIEWWVRRRGKRSSE